MSAIAGSLTTNATGMPIIEAIPTRQRSSSLKGATLNFHQSLSLNRLFAQHVNIEKKNQEEHNNETFVNNNLINLKVETNTKNSNESTNQTDLADSSNTNNITSDYESCDISPTNSDYTSDNDKMQLSVRVVFIISKIKY
jgi:hypothetical protein